MLKRLFDIVFAVVRILLCFPIFVVITIPTNVGSAGLVFFAKKELGDVERYLKSISFTQ